MTKHKRRSGQPKRDGHGEPLVADGMYYVEDSRGIVGNCMSFWCVDSKGYTTDLGLAGEYTGDDCLSMRDTDIPWPVAFIREHTVTHVRRDRLRRNGRDS